MRNIIHWKQEAGKKPSQRAIKHASTLVRPATKDHMVIAMALRPTGVTQQEVISLLGHPHRNIIRKLLAEDKVRKYEIPDVARSTRIKLVRKA